MIDWVTARLPCVHPPIDSGRVFKVDSSGDIEWESPCRRAIEGSHDQRITVRSVGGDGQGNATELLIDGNPSKFLQGHNIFGSDDLLSLVHDSFLVICSMVGLRPSLAELGAIESGEYQLSRVDINYSFELPTRGDVRAWLRAAEFKSRTRHGRPSSRQGTLYWGKHSSRWSLKAYSKGDEIEGPKAHRLPSPLQETPLPRWADNKLRVEVVLRRKELKERGMSSAGAWVGSAPQKLFSEYVGNLEMSEQVALTSEKEMHIPRGFRSTYVLWKYGEDMRDKLPKTTYYRHRVALLEYGIDIALARETVDCTNVVPLIRIIQAEPVMLPEWAFSAALIHRSAALPQRAGVA